VAVVDGEIADLEGHFCCHDYNEGCDYTECMGSKIPVYSNIPGKIGISEKRQIGRPIVIKI
jgi:hypothetical protein